MYVKIIDNQIFEAPENYNGVMNYNLDIVRMLSDGYKLLIEAEIPAEDEIRMYHFEYEETAENILEKVVFDETTQEAEARIERIHKEERTQEINKKIAELEQMSLSELLYGHEENIKIYQEIINSLKKSLPM